MADALGKFMIHTWRFQARRVLSVSQLMFTGSTHEIDSSIMHFQLVLSISAQSDPCRPLFVLILALMRCRRNRRPNRREDLDKSIVHLTESILLPPPSCSHHGSTILHTLYILACEFYTRSNVFRQPQDAIYAAKYLTYLRCQPHEISGVPRHRVTTLLVDALAFQVVLEAGNVMQNFREMAVLCRELLTLDKSDIDTTHLIHLIHGVVASKLRMGVPDKPLDELIECLRAARKRRPDLLKGRLALAVCLICRYCMTVVNDDYEEAASLLDEIITSSPPRDSHDESFGEDQASATMFATGLARIRSNSHQSPEYLEETIYRTRASWSSSSCKKHYPFAVFGPEDIAKERFEHFGSIGGDDTLSDDLSSQPALMTPKLSRTIDEMNALSFGILSHEDTTKIDETIEKGRTILASYSPTDVGRGHVLDLFGDVLSAAFLRTLSIGYINQAISAYRQILESPGAELRRFQAFGQISASLVARFTAFPGHRTQDLDEELELLSQCVADTRANSPNRFKLACQWAFYARRTRHPSVSTAYESALSLMQDTLHFSPTLQLQHTNLATHDKTQSLPLDYASHQVELHRLEEAIETLESGRALLWSEMRRLRTSTDQLLKTDPDLGHKFAAVNRELEELTKSVPPSHKLSMDDGPADKLKAVDPFGRLLLKQRRLLKERDNLISQIQSLPGFHNFLSSPSFETLRTAASSGPVIIINHSEWRSDILILLHNTPPSLIPTPDNFHKRAHTLKGRLLDARQKDGLDSDLYDQTLASVLEELYKLVGKPVIRRLRRLKVPEQSRIWWCPTSVFCSLPLHAMGPILSDDAEPRCFLDLYICSYTPTLSALIQSRNHNSCSRSSDRPSILLVAQPDPSLPTVRSEIQVPQSLDTEVTSLISAAATPATVIDGFHYHGFVHLACHGRLVARKPFEAGFDLHGDERLTLLEIVRSHLPTAEFAFLSACHTAEASEGSIMDEGLHLAAAVQYCGFRSVVGTMWAMVDEDGRDLAKHFYKALFSNSRRDQGMPYPEAVPYHERSAEALRFAVKKLRRKRGITIERWANFVHYGA